MPAAGDGLFLCPRQVRGRLVTGLARVVVEVKVGRRCVARYGVHILEQLQQERRAQQQRKHSSNNNDNDNRSNCNGVRNRRSRRRAFAFRSR